MARGTGARLLILAGLVAALEASAHDEHRTAAEAAGGPSAGYAFPLATPGSYELPVIKTAASGSVLDERGLARDLTELLRGRLTVLAFIYTRCGDVCPTASSRLAALQDLAARHPQVASQTRLISMSFDPEHDKPEVMAEYASNWRSIDPKAPEWHFVTAPDRASLEPVLKAYDQSVMAKAEPSATGSLYHILRVFLIDRTGMIRNIYSLDFLDPELVLGDLETLAIERQADDSRGRRQPPLTPGAAK
jgi:cytochrome oxidase Cu insertion factor (SCO1/SenC/PrrC family)